MRFLHLDFEPVREFLTLAAQGIRRLEWDREPFAEGGFAFLPWTLKRRAAERPRPANVDEIEAFFRRGVNPEQAGSVLKSYFHVNAPPSEATVSLSGAVEHVEAFGAPLEIVLVGYPDGGLISVSREPLPFQERAKPAEWWGP